MLITVAFAGAPSITSTEMPELFHTRANGPLANCRTSINRRPQNVEEERSNDKPNARTYDRCGPGAPSSTRRCDVDLEHTQTWPDQKPSEQHVKDDVATAVFDDRSGEADISRGDVCTRVEGATGPAQAS